MDTQAYLLAEQTKQLEEATTCLRDQVLIRLPRRLGCRTSEALNIAVEDIDFAKSRVTILHLKSRTKLSCPTCGARLSKRFKLCPDCGAPVQSVIEKITANKRVRTIPIDADTLKLIREYVDGANLPRVGGKHKLFNICRERAWQICVEAANRAGLPKIYNPDNGKIHNVSLHKLRDAFAVNAIKQDNTTDGARLLQEQLGHKDIGTTLKYRKVAGDELQDWYNKLTEKAE